MKRNFWNSGWSKPEYHWCDKCGRILRHNEECFCIHIKGERISVPEFEIRANPTIRWADMSPNRYRPLENARRRLEEAITLRGDTFDDRVETYISRYLDRMEQETRRLEEEDGEEIDA